MNFSKLFMSTLLGLFLTSSVQTYCGLSLPHLEAAKILKKIGFSINAYDIYEFISEHPFIAMTLAGLAVAGGFYGYGKYTGYYYRDLPQTNLDIEDNADIELQDLNTVLQARSGLLQFQGVKETETLKLAKDVAPQMVEAVENFYKALKARAEVHNNPNKKQDQQDYSGDIQKWRKKIKEYAHYKFK